MTLYDFLKKNNREHDAVVCKSDGAFIASFHAEEFDSNKYPEIADAEEFLFTPDNDYRIYGDNSPEWDFWRHYFDYLYDAKIIRKQYDGREDEVTVFLEPELYVCEGEAYRPEDLRKAYQEFGEEGESFEDWMRNSDFVQIL